MNFEARGKHVRLPMEVREADGAIRVEGYAAVFNEETDIAGMFKERIEPGAFTEALREEQDVVFLFNHNSDTVMARTRSGTLQLTEDERGLKMQAELSGEDPDVKRIFYKMQRGDLDKMSFAFYPEVEEWDDSQEMPVRTIKRASLHDVSAVTNPAYDGTEIGLRSLENHLAEIRKQNNKHAARLRRMRMNLGLIMASEG